jgi:TetR/AcrR family transcriptional regulator
MPDDQPADLPDACPASKRAGRQRRKAARPQELLAAALTQFVTKGLAATRIDDVARLAGVSKGTLYLYYASKEELFKAVVRNSLGLVIAQGSELVDRWEGDTTELLHGLAHTWWSQVGGSDASGIFKLVIAEVGNFPELAQFYVDEVIAPTHTLLGKAVARGIARGEFRQLDVTTVVHALMATAQFLALYNYCAGCAPNNPFPLSSDTFMQTQIDLLLHGLKTPPNTDTTEPPGGAA